MTLKSMYLNASFVSCKRRKGIKDTEDAVVEVRSVLYNVQPFRCLPIILSGSAVADPEIFIGGVKIFLGNHHYYFN